MVAKKTTRKAAPKKTARKSVKKAAVSAPRVSPAPRIGGWWYNSFSGAGVLIAVAAIMGIVAFFTAWLSCDAMSIKFTFDGRQLIALTGDHKEFWFGKAWQTIIPLITLILSILALLAISLPAMKVRANQYGVDALVILCGIVMFILSICFLFGQFEAQMAGFMDISGKKFIDALGVGFYLTIVASIVMILGGLRDATKGY